MMIMRKTIVDFKLLGENMTPNLKIHSFSFGISSVIIYNFWKHLYPMETNNFIINFIVTFLVSLSFYKLVFHLILVICKKTRFIKKIVLGKNYFEGLWIGYFIVGSKVEYYYELFEQDLEELTIKGRSFNPNKELTGEWTIHKPIVNVSDSKFTYYYEMDVANSNDVTLGYSKATIYWNKFSLPKKLVGFAVDKYSSEKQPYVSIKVCDNCDYEQWVNDNFWHRVEEMYCKTLDF